MRYKLLGLFILSFSVVISCPSPQDNLPDGKELTEEINLNNYVPFSADNKLAVLTENATIQFLNYYLPRLDGATALYPVYASFVQATYPSTQVYYPFYESRVKCSTTPYAFTNLIAGGVDIIFTAAPSQDQISLAAEKEKTFSLTPIGKDAFVFFVNKQNPVNNLSIEQIRGIYSGKITNWKEVGGNDGEIYAFQRNRDSGSQTALISIMDGVPLMQAPMTLGSMADGPSKVADYRNHGNSIGYSFLFYTTEMVNNNEIKLLSINNVMPTIETIRSDEYLFSGSFYAITTGDESENVKVLIEWILSDQGQYLIEKTGYVPIR